MTAEPKRIVVADDDPSLRHLLVDTLQTIGYHAQGAADGVAALDLLGRDRFDLVISDISMPNMNGFDLARTMRREYPGVRILFITGVATQESQAKAKAEKLCDGYLAKPFRIDRIEAMIETVLGGSSASEAPLPGRVLIVDDDPRFLDAMVDTVLALGYPAEGVHDCGAAMSVLEREPVSIVIADVSMPTMNGFDLLKTLKRSYPRIPVVMMTGHNLSEPAAALIRSSADAYLTKPFRHEAVRELLHRLEARQAT